jgi:hypothetical protein
MFKKYKFEEKFSCEYLYPTTHDAVLHIVLRAKKKISNGLNKSEIVAETLNENNQNKVKFIDDIDHEETESVKKFAF